MAERLDSGRNPKNSLYFPWLTAKSRQRRVRSRLPAPPPIINCYRRVFRVTRWVRICPLGLPGMRRMCPGVALAETARVQLASRSYRKCLLHRVWWRGLARVGVTTWTGTWLGFRRQFGCRSLRSAMACTRRILRSSAATVYELRQVNGGGSASTY